MLLTALTLTAEGAEATPLTAFQGEDIFQRVLRRAESNNWSRLPMGELVGKIALEFEGIPYKGSTLEVSSDKEICSVNLTSLDCVTFFETCLAFARMLKRGGRTPASLLSEIGFIRYRAGKPGDFSSRLHYTSDWFADNQSKRVVTLLSELPGVEPFPQKVGFMSTHPKLYRQLSNNPRLIAAIKQQEGAINKRSLNFVPLDKIASVEPLLHTGDIIGICTNIEGLDISHTGLIMCTADGVRHLMDASTITGKVTLEKGPLRSTLNWSSQLTGAIFARPRELS